MSREILRSLGLPPHPTPAQVAQAVALRVPVHLGGPPAQRPPAEVAARGEGGAPEEVLSLLACLLPGGAVERGGALPRLRVREGVVGPGLPVMVTPQGVEGPDGWYRLSGDEVLRETAGRELPFAAGLPEHPALMLFTDGGRWLLGGGRTVVEDPFCRVEAPLSRAWAEGFLVRRRRLAEALLRHPVLQERRGRARATITAWRAAELLPPSVTQDPEMVLRAREGVRTLRWRREVLEVDLETGGHARLRTARVTGGWRAELEEGHFPLEVLELAGEGETIRYTWSVGTGLDLLDPGVRARLAFDLNSDLVRLGQNL